MFSYVFRQPNPIGLGFGGDTRKGGEAGDVTHFTHRIALAAAHFFRSRQVLSRGRVIVCTHQTIFLKIRIYSPLHRQTMRCKHRAFHLPRAPACECRGSRRARAAATRTARERMCPLGGRESLEKPNLMIFSRSCWLSLFASCCLHLDLPPFHLPVVHAWAGLRKHGRG